MEKITTGAEIVALSYNDAEALFENGPEVMEKLEGFQKFGKMNTATNRKAYWDMPEGSLKDNPTYVAGFNFAKEAKEEYAALYLDTLQHEVAPEAPAEIADPTPAPTPVTKENKTDEVVLETSIEATDPAPAAEGEQFYLAEITDELAKDPTNFVSNLGLILQLATYAEVNTSDIPASLRTQLEKTRARIAVKA